MAEVDLNNGNVVIQIGENVVNYSIQTTAYA